MVIGGPRPCPACAQPQSQGAGEAGGFELRRCQSCRTLFTARLPEAAESLDYDSYYHAGNLEVPAFVLQRLDEHVARFEAYRSGNRWLDVGCGAGTLMQAARARGWDASGTEVARGAAEAVRTKGFEVGIGTLEELDLEPGAYDVVSLVEVVEHVPDPRGLLAAAAPLLRPGGALYVTTPHGRGISARILGTDWSVVAPPEHLQLFSLPGIRAAATYAGTEPRRLVTQAANPRELLARFRPRQAPVAAGERVDSGYRLNAALSSRRGGRGLKRAVNATLSATQLGDSIRLIAERRA